MGIFLPELLKDAKYFYAKYFYAGKMISLSLANGGPVFPCLSETVYSYICHGLNFTIRPTMEDLPDSDIKGQLEEVTCI